MPENQDKRTFWRLALVGTSLLYVLAVVLIGPWYMFYKNNLLWEDRQGLSVIGGLTALLNAITLVVRVRILEEHHLRWNDVEDSDVSMTIFSLGNVLFFGGLALWTIYDYVHVAPIFCYLVTVSGALIHTVLHFLRWKRLRGFSNALLAILQTMIVIGLSAAIVILDPLITRY
ncbi:MAG: hypothetical protein K2Z81_04555 [Cyanobacteria bacterium]|nr:hypothetical protein [Cyanobacteriota bacterium]